MRLTEEELRKLTNAHEEIPERPAIAVRARSPPYGAVQPRVELSSAAESIRARLAKAEHMINSLRKMQRHTVTLESLTVPVDKGERRRPSPRKDNRREAATDRKRSGEKKKSGNNSR
jgi:hypothetical protein